MRQNGVISSYTISTGFPQVDGRSMDPRILGCHTYIMEKIKTKPFHVYLIFLKFIFSKFRLKLKD